MRYNPPPNWPQPPAGWAPPQGWQPDPSWGPPPPGWALWVEDKPAGHRTRNVVLSVGAVVVILVVVASIAGGNDSKTPTSSGAPTSGAATVEATSAAPVPSSAAPATSSAAIATSVAAPTTTKAATTSAPGIIGANEAAKKDVRITACGGKDALNDVKAKVLITNHSSKASNYIISVAFDSPDGKTQLGTGIAAVNDLQPGQKSAQDVASLDTATGKYVCRVSEVTRYAAGG